MNLQNAQNRKVKPSQVDKSIRSEVKKPNVHALISALKVAQAETFECLNQSIHMVEPSQVILDSGIQAYPPHTAYKVIVLIFYVLCFFPEGSLAVFKILYYSI